MLFSQLSEIPRILLNSANNEKHFNNEPNYLKLNESHSDLHLQKDHSDSENKEHVNLNVSKLSKGSDRVKLQIHKLQIHSKSENDIKKAIEPKDNTVI